MNKRILLLFFAAALSIITSAQISITNIATPYTQDFNTLANTGTSAVLPAGWLLSETGTGANTTYVADNGAGNSGNTYSYGPTGNAERALGSLQSGSVENSADKTACLTAFMLEADRLDRDTGIETTFLIFPNSFERFDDYLDLVSLAEKLLKTNGYEGIYQVASFHPLYLFANTTDNDASNYTNRSVYPMLHLLRESSIDAALEHYKDPEAIPGRNIDFARNKGLVYMQMLRESCF